MRTKPKDQRVSVESDPGRERRGAEEQRRLEEVVALFEKWRSLLGLPEKAEFELHLYTDPLEEDAKMEVEWDKAMYGRYSINVGPQPLEVEFDPKRRGYVVHELVHILNYPYTRVAEFFAKTEHNKQHLSEMEEEMTCRLDEAICAVADHFYEEGFKAGQKAKKKS